MFWIVCGGIIGFTALCAMLFALERLRCADRRRGIPILLVAVGLATWAISTATIPVMPQNRAASLVLVSLLPVLTVAAIVYQRQNRA